MNGSWLLYVICFLVPIAIGLGVQAWLRSTFTRFSKTPVASGKTGADVAREVLDRNGLRSVPVNLTKTGALSDHYDPGKRQLNLSEQVYAGRSVAASAVAAHEVGHAIQHAEGYVPMRARALVWPLAAFGSRTWLYLLLMGMIFDITGLKWLGVVVYAAVVVFQLVTLPVEFNASRRAAAELQGAGLVTAGEAAGVRKTLTAAAMTYVAGALAAIAQLMYFLAIFGGDSD